MGRSTCHGEPLNSLLYSPSPSCQKGQQEWLAEVQQAAGTSRQERVQDQVLPGVAWVALTTGASKASPGTPRGPAGPAHFLQSSSTGMKRNRLMAPTVLWAHAHCPQSSLQCRGPQMAVWSGLLVGMGLS